LKPQLDELVSAVNDTGPLPMAYEQVAQATDQPLDEGVDAR
jgi:hypothetical protein